jgi:dihydroorotate dehydrogenase
MRLLPPETAHEATLRALQLGLGPHAGADDPILRTSVAGVVLPNPVGVAAGFDKDARAPDALLAAGFGFAECGSITPRPQAGNPKPRLFRLTEDRAVINRMGFNNQGHAAARARLARRTGRPGAVGVNLGANKDSADRVADYVAGLEAFHGLAAYFTINVSSPNTPGLRDLQGEQALRELLAAVRDARLRLEETVPVFLKIAPDIADDDAPRIVEAARSHGVDGLIVSNTTIARPDSLHSAHAREAGGLSGAPLRERATDVLRLARQASGPDFTLIGVGGIGSADDAYARIRAGANAVQLYTALVYEGPGLVRRIKHGLAQRLRADGFATAAEAVGR